MSAPVGTPAAPFDAGTLYMIRIGAVDGHDGMLDHDTRTIHIDPSAAGDPDVVADLVRVAWEALGEASRPELTVVEGGGDRRTKRRGNLRLVSA